jgi:hypothetical protein
VNARYRSRTEEARGSNPLTSTPKPAGQSVASVERAALTACCGRTTAARAVAVQPRTLAATRRLGPRPHTMTTQGSRCLAAHPGSPPTSDPPAHPADPGRPRARPSHDPTTAHDDGQVQADPSAGPARPAPGSTAAGAVRPGRSVPGLHHPLTLRERRSHQARIDAVRHRGSALSWIAQPALAPGCQHTVPATSQLPARVNTSLQTAAQEPANLL